MAAFLIESSGRCTGSRLLHSLQENSLSFYLHSFLSLVFALTFYLYYFPPLPLLPSSYPSPPPIPFFSCVVHTPSFITLRSSIFISRSPEIFTVFFLSYSYTYRDYTHGQDFRQLAMHARPFNVGLNVGIFEIGEGERASKRAKGEGKRVRPLFYPGLIAPLLLLLLLLRSFIFKSTPRYRWQCWHFAIKRAYTRHVLDTCKISPLPFLFIDSKNAKYFSSRFALIRQAIDLSIVANEQKYIYLFFLPN